ncbi:MAG: hypothetical protein D8H91_09955 [Alloprevotella sp.]|nr:MAG: hypothetical protein D8H91_09955 [Alloprevotella sp.]
MLKMYMLLRICWVLLELCVEQMKALCVFSVLDQRVPFMTVKHLYSQLQVWVTFLVMRGVELR